MRFRHLTSAVAQILLNASSGPILRGNDFLLVKAGNGTPSLFNISEGTFSSFGNVSSNNFAATSDKIALAHGANAVRVYDHSGNVLADISGPNGVNFGASIKMTDTKVFASAPGDDTSGTDSGAIYVYDHDGSNETKITFPGSNNDYSGNAIDRLAVGSGKIAVGSEYYPNFSFKGKVDLMDEDGSNVITIYPALSNQSNFGSTVNIHNDKLYISAPGSNAKKVYEYDLSGSLLRTFDDPQGGTGSFGSDVSFYGSKMAVSATGREKCYIFDLESASQEYVEVSYAGHHTKQTSNQNTAFGQSLELTSDSLFVGAPTETNNGVSNSGLIFQFDHSGAFITKYDVTDIDHLNNNQQNQQIGMNMTLIPGAYPEKMIVAEGVKNYATDRKVYVMDMNGENLIELPEPKTLTQSSTSQYASNIEIASEGKLVVIHNETKTAYVYDLTTTNEPTAFTLDASTILDLDSFVLEGNKLYCLGMENVTNAVKKLMRYDITTGNLESLFTNNSNYTLISSTIDVGNGKVAVVSGTDSDPRKILVYDIDDTTGSSEVQITPTSTTNTGPCSLAVGNGKIVYGDNQGNGSFYIYNLDGSNETIVDCTNISVSNLWSVHPLLNSNIGAHSIAIGNEKIALSTNRDNLIVVSNLDGSELFVIDFTYGEMNVSGSTTSGLSGSSGSFYIANNKIVLAATRGRNIGDEHDGIIHTFDLDGTNHTMITAPRGLGSDYKFGQDVTIYDPTGLAKFANLPAVISDIDASYTLTEGQDTVITAIGTDPEGDAITWSFEEIKSGASYVVVGAHNEDDNGSNSGSVYVYDANDLSAQPTKLTAFDGAAGDRFGESVAVTADKIVIGAYADDDNGSSSGSVYVYDTNDLSAQPTKLTAFDGASGDRFSRYAISATADKIVVGAYADDDNGSSSGSVYVFDANDLSAQPTKLTAFDDAAGDNFGYSVAATADKIVVGAWSDDDNGSDSGSVYVYDTNDLSAQPTKLTAFDGAANDYFGYSVAATADKIIVGAPVDDDNADNSGSVYVYDANDLSAQPTKLTAFDGAATDQFGEEVAATADKIIVGAWSDDDNGSDSGSVYVYDANDLSAQPTKLTAFDGAANDYFSRYAISATADKIVVGAWSDDDNASNVGSVYAYDANDLSAQPTKLTAFDGAAGDSFGISVAAISATSALNGVTVTQSDNVFTITPGTTDANFTLRFKVTDAAGNVTTKTSTFTYDYVNKAPIVSGIVSEYNLTQGQGTVITAAATDPEGDAITWSFEEVMSTGSTYVFAASPQTTAGGEVKVYQEGDLNTVVATLSPSDVAAGDAFGYAMTVAGDKLAIASRMDDNNGAQSGSVYVYDTNDFSAAPVHLVPSDGAAYDFLSGAMTSNSDKIVAMASSGKKVYVWDTNDLGGQPTVLAPSDASGDLGWGGLEIVGDNLLIGDPGVGKSWIYVYDLNDLSASPSKITRDDATQGTGAGGGFPAYYGLTSNDTYVAVGHHGWTTGSGTQGAVYLFSVNDFSAPVHTIYAKDNNHIDSSVTDTAFGSGIGLSDDKLFVGNWNHTGGGAVYVYDLNDLTAQPSLLTPTNGDVAFGWRQSLNVSSTHLYVGAKNSSAMYAYALSDLSAAPTRITGDGEFGHTIVSSSGSSALNGTTVAQSDNVFTVTPAQQDATFQLTFKATDSEGNVTSVTSDFDFTYVNQAPSVTGIESSYLLSAGGSGTAITAVGTDPEGDAITWSFEEVVSGGGSQIVIGSFLKNNYSGSVFVYENGDLSSSPTEIYPSDVASGDRFGQEIAVTPSHMAVSTWNGKVYVYDQSDLSVAPTKLTSPEGVGNFGQEGLAINDTHLFVGQLSGGPDSNGVVYVYSLSDLSASPTELSQTGGEFLGDGGDRFGSVVAVDNQSLVVSAPYYDNGVGAQNVGRLYVYDVNDLSATPTIVSNVGYQDNKETGYRELMLTSDKIIVGSHAHEDGSGVRKGAVFVHDRNNLDQAPVIVMGHEENGNFGLDAYSDGDILVVGAPSENSSTGAAYVYNMSDLSAAPTKLTAYDGAANDGFGWGVYATDSNILIGSYNDDDAGNNSGAVYVYDRSDLSVQPTKLIGQGPNAYFGNTFAGYSPSSSLNGTTVTQSDNVFTVTPGSEATSFSMRFTATDANGNETTTTSAFSIVEPAAPLLVIGASNDNQVGVDAGAIYVYDRSDLTATPTKIAPPAATTPMTSTYTMKHLQDDGGWDSSAGEQFHTETPEHALYVVNQFDYVVNNLLTGTQKVARMEFIDMSGRALAFFQKNESIDSVTGGERGPYAPYNEVGKVALSGTPGNSFSGGFYSIPGLPYTEMRAIRFIDAQGNHIYTSETIEYTPIKGYFGSAVEFVNNKMVVSAPFSSTSYGEKVGRLFVYNPSDLTSDPAMLSLPESMSVSNLYLGKQLAYDSTRIFAGTPNYNTGRGSVFIFDTDNLSADPIQLTSPESAPYDNFGFSIATNSSSLFISEPRSNESNISDTGVVFVYDLNNISVTPTKLTAPTLTAAERFGDFVVATDQHVVVSCPTALSYKGKIYVYNATDLSATPTELTAPDGLNNDQFGKNMVLSGNTLAISAPYADPQDNNSGAVYVYDMSNLSAAPTILTQSDFASNDQLGGNDSYVMEISDNKLYIPSRGSDGSVYVFDLTNLSAAPTKITSIDSHSGQNFGLHIAAN